MSHATKYHIGENQTDRKKATNAIVPTVGRVRILDAKTEGRQRNQERQTEIRTDSHAANSFLKTSFLPKLQETKMVQVCRGFAGMERDFYQSLSILAEHYKIEPMQTNHFQYPYNMALAFWDLREKLKEATLNRVEVCLVQDGRKSYLTCEELYDTSSTLYYIPILPLYRLSKKPSRKKAVQVLQSVCSYLYHIAEVPFYRQGHSYLYWMYEMVAEWVTSDDENEQTAIYESEIKQAEWIGEVMGQKIYNHHNLSRFKERLDGFEANDGFDNDCFMLGSKAFALFEQYPNGNIFRNIGPKRGAEEEYDDEDDYKITMDKYISFCAEAKGLLFQSLFQSVNGELQEYTQIEEPAILKHFDGRNISGNTLDFENRVFSLMEELIYILNSF